MREYPLTQKQLRILKLSYKFRFVTVNLLAQHLGLAISTMSTNIKILHRRKLLDRRYDKKDKLAGRGAQYYLTTKGIKELKQVMDLNDGVARSFYKNNSVSDAFVEHSLAIFKAYLAIRSQYPDRFTILTKTEISNYDQFPELKPDLFLQSDTGSFYLYLYTDTQLFIIQKHIKKLIEHEYEGEWPGDYPTVLIACPNPRIEYKLIKFLEGSLDDVNFLVTTTKALIQSQVTAIWTLDNDNKPNEL